MDWLTIEEIQKAADTSLLAAVRCSKKHWWQLATATEKELFKKAGEGEFLDDIIKCEYCALCHLFLNKGKQDCPLRHRDRGCDACCTEWINARGAFDDWNEEAFTKAAHKLHKRLCAEERKLKAIVQASLKIP